MKQYFPEQKFLGRSSGAEWLNETSHQKVEGQELP